MSWDHALVLCADDFGLDAGVCEGILALLQAGRLHATSVMCLAPCWATHAPALSEVRAHASVGLHLDLTSPWSGWCGGRRSLGTVLARATLRLDDGVAIEGHIEQQFDAFERHWKAPPSHVDGHQHVHQLPQWREALLAVLQRRYGGARPWLRIARAPRAGLKGAVITATGAAALEQQARAVSWPVRTPLLGVYDFRGGGQRYARLMRGWLQEGMRSGGVLMCHPGCSDDPADPIGAARRWEHRHLASEQFALDWRQCFPSNPLVAAT